ncbi:Uncharacterised protein [Mannheimia haemolytica]|uniref:Uncharacterized protein n=1 Tax=Mannheimia haemolytica TaxID=75985 RepID=A0A378N0E2_MANHA|nr:Uncharacterised protein [Mannheimia haemolytica]
MRLCDTDIKRYLDEGIIAITPRPSDDKFLAPLQMCV